MARFVKLTSNRSRSRNTMWFNIAHISHFYASNAGSMVSLTNGDEYPVNETPLEVAEAIDEMFVDNNQTEE